MLLAGDELGRSQSGNNNAYCQDNEISWIDWEGIDPEGRALHDFVRRLLELRRKHRVLHRRRFFRGLQPANGSAKDITWLAPGGRERVPEDWLDPSQRSLAFLLSGAADEYHVDASGAAEPDDSFFVVLNASDVAIDHELPRLELPCVWECVLDTAHADEDAGKSGLPGDAILVEARSVVCFVSRGAGPHPRK
jgi:glycogen operon protein